MVMAKQNTLDGGYSAQRHHRKISDWLNLFPTENHSNAQCVDRKLQKQVGVILFYL